MRQNEWQRRRTTDQQGEYIGKIGKMEWQGLKNQISSFKLNCGPCPVPDYQEFSSIYSSDVTSLDEG